MRPYVAETAAEAAQDSGERGKEAESARATRRCCAHRSGSAPLAQARIAGLSIASREAAARPAAQRVTWRCSPRCGNTAQAMHPWIVVASVMGASGVIGGAFGAHALKRVLAPARLDAFETAISYWLLHAIVLLALGLYARAAGTTLGWAPRLLLVGSLLFTGSIVVLVTTPIRGIGWVTPVGGACLIAGWVVLALELGR